MTEVDLASRVLGGSVVAASDESFGFKERLIDPAEPAFVPGMYDLRGEVVDGWETRRHAGRCGDWAIVRLGAAGRVQAVDVDTRFFSGNHPTACRIDGAVLPVTADPTAAGIRWTQLVESTVLKADSHNRLPVHDPRRWTHLRLRLGSDGGVARNRRGRAVPCVRGGDTGSRFMGRRDRRGFRPRERWSCRMVQRQFLFARLRAHRAQPSGEHG
jgi:allantoicase